MSCLLSVHIRPAMQQSLEFLQILHSKRLKKKLLKNSVNFLEENSNNT